MSDELVIEDIIEDLKRIQEFKTASLVQRDRLGADSSFEDAVEHSQRLVDLYKRLPTEIIWELPANRLGDLQKWCKSTYNLFDEILHFKLQGEGDPAARRQSLIENVRNAYQGQFDNLHPLISYAVSRTVDFNALEERARASIQEIRDNTSELLEAISQQKKMLIRYWRTCAKPLLKEVFLMRHIISNRKPRAIRPMQRQLKRLFGAGQSPSGYSL